MAAQEPALTSLGKQCSGLVASNFATASVPVSAFPLPVHLSPLPHHGIKDVSVPPVNRPSACSGSLGLRARIPTELTQQSEPTSLKETILEVCNLLNSFSASCLRRVSFSSSDLSMLVALLTLLMPPKLLLGA